MSDINSKINDIIIYAESLIGIKYVRWEKGKECNFHCDVIPSLDELKNDGVNCASFINVLILYSGKKIPHHRNIFRGGTLFWTVFFQDKKVLENFDYTKKYPLGTLFIRNFRDEKDQGHIAMLSDYYTKEPSKILYSNIIHAYYYKNFYGIGKTKLGISHFSNNDDKGYYEYAVLPENWYNILDDR